MDESVRPGDHLKTKRCGIAGAIAWRILKGFLVVVLFIFIAFWKVPYHVIYVDYWSKSRSHIACKLITSFFLIFWSLFLIPLVVFQFYFSVIFFTILTILKCFFYVLFCCCLWKKKSTDIADSNREEARKVIE